MAEQYEIIDNPLPPGQDFKYLKGEGLAFIQKCTGNQWTNLNAGDPGITILDQVCYALTELGYCNNFPVADILTGADGKLTIKNQFYLPEEILTTSPLTVDDYRKYIIDTTGAVDNAAITTYSGNIIPLNKCYQVYLLIDPSITANSIDIPGICEAAYYSLNKSRNLGELFLMPQALQKMTYTLSGEIEIANEQDQNNVLLKIQNAVRNYIFPDVGQTGYNQLIEAGVGTDEIFNGPMLKNGWITDKTLGSKKDQLHAFELGPVIESVPGVMAASVSGFYEATPVTEPLADIQQTIHSQQDQVLFIDILGSITGRSLEIKCNNTVLTFQPGRILSASPGRLPETEQKIVYGARVNIHAELPTGTFRDINTYYSIQNTFPGIYAVGEDAVPAGATAGQVALSRQLKGYLTLYDQVLANQFSQLANISNLFSFKNSTTATPSALEAFNATKTKFERNGEEYPVPFKSFSPTYYYQPVYDIPGIRPLLKDNGAFKYSYEQASEDELEEKSWVAYRQDPYNAYMYGLMQLVENENENLHRRNEMLDHLLARHGESPLLVEAITAGFPHTGNEIGDKVIFKSLYLQNLGLLSYYRQRAYYYLGADRIGNELLMPANEEYIDEATGGDTVDFIFNSGKIDRLEKLTERDFINYSATELKLNLLFGLRYRYRDFIKGLTRLREVIENFIKDADRSLELKIITAFEKTILDFLKGKGIEVLEKDIENILATVIEKDLLNELPRWLEDQAKIALWFIKKRKGSILIETALLWKDLYFNLTIAQPIGAWSFWLVEKHYQGSEQPLYSPGSLSYEEAVLVNSILSSQDQEYLDKLVKNDGTFRAGKNYYKLKRLELLSTPVSNYQPLNKTNYLSRLVVAGHEEDEMIDTLFNTDLVLIFPGFIRTPDTRGFDDRLELFMQNTLPVTTRHKLIYAGTGTLEELIPAFTKWHDSLCYHQKNKKQESIQDIIIEEQRKRRRCAQKLLGTLVKLYPRKV